MADETKLNAKQAAFVREYLIDNNGAQAAIRAGYSAHTAKEKAAHLLTIVNVRTALTAAQANVAEAAGITAVMVALEYKKLAFSNLTDYVEWGPDGVKLKASVDLKDAGAVLEVSESITESGRTRKIKLHDKKGSLDSLCKQLGFNAPDKAELKVEAKGNGLTDTQLAGSIGAVLDRIRARTPGPAGEPGNE